MWSTPQGLLPRVYDCYNIYGQKMSLDMINEFVVVLYFQKFNEMPSRFQNCSINHKMSGESVGEQKITFLQVKRTLFISPLSLSVRIFSDFVEEFLSRERGRIKNRVFWAHFHLFERLKWDLVRCNFANYKKLYENLCSSSFNSRTNYK